MKILVTGGASGLGEVITRKLAGNNNNTIFFTYNASLANAKILEKELVNAKGIKCDFKNDTDLAVLEKAMAELELDVLINNAYSGSFIESHFHKTDPDKFLNEFTTNIMPVIRITQAAILSFRKKKQGKIITVLTSALINTPPVGASAYVANKAYLEAMTKVWATENIKFNITSNSVSPAFMQTAFTKSMDDRLVDQIREGHPLKKLLEPSDVADTIEFLCTTSSQINGTNIIINSGAVLK